MELKAKSVKSQGIISWLKEQSGKYVNATDDELAQFAAELNSKIGELNFDLPEGCKAKGLQNDFA